MNDTETKKHTSPACSRILRERRGPWLILVTFLALAFAWNATIPPYENLDEIEHTEVIRYIAATAKLPIHRDAEAAGFAVRQEASQPPLYHVLGAAWLQVWGLPLDPPTAVPIPATFVACGSGDTEYNRVTWSRDPYAAFPWEPHRLSTFGLRLFSTLLQCATIAGTWEIARRIAPQGPVAPLATAIVAFNPQFLLVASGVNNDNLVTPLATWALVVLLGIWARGPAPRRLIGFGVLTGLAALSKLSGLGLLALGGLTLLALARRRHASPRQFILWGLMLGTPVLLLVAPWMLRNWHLYGDPTALSPMLGIVGRTTVQADICGTVQLMARSYWGQLPCAFYPRALYWPFFLLLGGGLVGITVRRRRTKPAAEGLLILAGWFLIILAAWIRWNALTPATGGRLLFPAAPALAVIIAVGWQRFTSSLTRGWAILLPILAIVTLITGAAPLFSPPARLEALPSAAIPTNFSFGENSTIQLRGYTSRLVESGPLCWLSQPSNCRPALEIELFMEATDPPLTDHAMAVQLVSARPGDNTLRLTYDAWTGHGNLPTTSWPVGILLQEQLRLPLPNSNLPTQAWDLQIAFYDPETRSRLPVNLGSQTIGDVARLTTLRVSGTQPSCALHTPLETPVRFGEAVTLTHAAVSTSQDTWEVTLCWQSLAQLTDDYTVFVHAYAANGELLATGDGPPMQSAFPTRLWMPGDRILDVHTFTGPETPDTIGIGLYHPDSGGRLEASVGNQRLTNDAFLLTP